MSRRVLSLTALLLAALSTAALAYSVYDYRNSLVEPGLRVERPEVTLTDLEPGKDYQWEYVVMNDGPGPARLIGADARCVAGGCFGPKLDSLPTIPPGGRVGVGYDLHMNDSVQNFAADSTLFFEWRGELVRLEVKANGRLRQK